MPSVALNDIDHMREAVFFDGPDVKRKLSRFWILLILASVIAAAGVIGDSTATVIGAMIVAPLMTPILGTMLGVVLGDRANLIRSILLVIAGAAAAILIGYVLGMGISDPVTAATNGQVAARVNPRLIDLVAALATGAVGSVALVRRDISDTLPGVAIAISLVPPLSVVGLTAESGVWDESCGSAVPVQHQRRGDPDDRHHRDGAVQGVPDGHAGGDGGTTGGQSAQRHPRHRRVLRDHPTPLVSSARRIADDRPEQSEVRRITQEWAASVELGGRSRCRRRHRHRCRVIGSPPIPETDSYAAALEAGGIDPDGVIVEFIPRAVVELGASD